MAGEPESMSTNATRDMFIAAAGFGIGALVVLFGFLFLVGIGELGHPANTAASPATKSAATAPAAPGPAPLPAPQTSGPPATTGQAPQPSQPSTPRAPTSRPSAGPTNADQK